MKLKKRHILIGLFILGMVILVLTPVRFYARKTISRLIYGGPAVAKEGMHVSPEDYKWDLRDTKGNDFNFKEQEGKVVLVNFWATWCPPCVAEMPSLQELYKGYGDKVVFMLVAKDKPEKVEAFLRKHQYDNLPVYYTGTQIPNLLASRILPTTYIIDKEGKIRVEERKEVDWNSEKIRSLLDTLLVE